MTVLTKVVSNLTHPRKKLNYFDTNLTIEYSAEFQISKLSSDIE
jgi:hypothetical protein